MDRQTLVRSVMSTALVTLSPEDDLAEALALMSDHALRRLPVIKTVGGEAVVVGIVSDRDVRLAANSPFVQNSVGDLVSQLRQIRVADVMSTDVATVFPSAPIAVAAQTMLARQVGGLPVVEQEAGKRFLVGMVSRADLLKRLIELEMERKRPAAAGAQDPVDAAGSDAAPTHPDTDSDAQAPTASSAETLGS